MSVSLDNLVSGPFLIALLLARWGIMLSLCAKPMRALILARRLTKTFMQRNNY